MISNKLKILRAKHNISQSDLAKRISVSRATIVSIENGKSIPGLDIALKLSYVFQINVNEIFFANAVNLDLQKLKLA